MSALEQTLIMYDCVSIASGCVGRFNICAQLPGTCRVYLQSVGRFGVVWLLHNNNCMVSGSDIGLASFEIIDPMVGLPIQDFEVQPHDTVQIDVRNLDDCTIAVHAGLLTTRRREIRPHIRVSERQGISTMRESDEV